MMKKMMTTMAALLLATIMTAQSTADENKYMSTKNEGWKSENVMKFDRTEMMAHIYNLNENQIKDVSRLNQINDILRSSAETKYLAKMNSLSPEKRTKMEKKFQSRMENIQDEYNDIIADILNPNQYKKYCVGFQLNQARMFRNMVRMNENHA